MNDNYCVTFDSQRLEMGEAVYIFLTTWVCCWTRRILEALLLVDGLFMADVTGERSSMYHSPEAIIGIFLVLATWICPCVKVVLPSALTAFTLNMYVVPGVSLSTVC